MPHPLSLLQLAEATNPPPQAYWRSGEWLAFAEETTLIEVTGKPLLEDDYESILAAAIADPASAVAAYGTIANSEDKGGLDTAVEALLVALVSRLSEGRVTFAEWQRQQAAIVTAAHLQAITLSLGREPTADDLATVEPEIRSQLYAGRENEPFGLRTLAGDVAAGGVSLSMLSHRATNYGLSLFVSYQLGEQLTARSAAKTHMIRALGNAEHCSACPGYANRLVLIGELPVPGQACPCGHNCKCSVRYLTLAEAVAEGLG